MKPDIKYINLHKPRKTLSNTTFKEDIVFPAHTLETPAFAAYVHKRAFDYAVACINQIAKTGNVEHATDWLKEMGMSE